MSNKSKIILDGIQIKNLEKAKLLAQLLNIIDEELSCGKFTIQFKNIFVCQWIDFDELNKTEMELLVKKLIE